LGDLDGVLPMVAVKDTVKIVKEGRLAQEFTGALPKAQIEAILGRTL
jgi:thioredoxin-like negative regulator of GroEL